MRSWNSVSLEKWKGRKVELWGIGIGIEVGMTWGSVKKSGEASPPVYARYKIHKPPQTFWRSLKSFRLQSQSQFLISPLFYLFTFLVIQSSKSGDVVRLFRVGTFVPLPLKQAVQRKHVSFLWLLTHTFWKIHSMFDHSRQAETAAK